MNRLPTELCDIALERITLSNERICALTDVLYGSAREEARRLEEGLARAGHASPVAGMPMVIKDNIDTVGARCSAGLPFLANYRPRDDAAIVARLREAGAVIVGMGATDSGAFGVLTPGVVNPIWPDRIVGGSSGGSAAAVAAGFCFAAIGTDTGGSVRIPAACCGVVGFKPTFGRLPVDGVRPLAPSFDHVGVIAASVADVRSVWEAIHPPVEASALAEARPVVGYPATFYAEADEEVHATMASALRALRAMGCATRTVELPPADDLVATHLLLSLAEAAEVQEQREGTLAIEVYPPEARAGLQRGRAYADVDRVHANARRSELLAQIESVMSEVDFLILPTLPVVPPKTTQTSASLNGRSATLLDVLIRYTAPFDQTGQPAVALPWCAEDAPTPASVQLVGRADSDERLLRFAQALEAHAPARRGRFS